MPIYLTTLLQAGIGDPNQFNNYLLLGYVAMWAIGLVYIIIMNTRQRNLEKDINLLKRLLKDHDETAES